jgi:hypothetical protein
MTFRTTPFGVVVLVFASLFAVGCTAETAAVFESLIDPARAPASPSDTGPASDGTQTGAASPAWWPHPDGYAMTLPAGWTGVIVNRAQSGRLTDAVDVTLPGVAERIEAVLGTTKSRVTAVAVDVSGEGAVSPLLIVVAQPTDGKRAHGVKTRVLEQISNLPGIQGIPGRHDVRLPAGSGVRFEYSIVDPDLGTLRVYSYLFRFGSQAYLVNFVASQDAFDSDAEQLFESIAESLRFGV